MIRLSKLTDYAVVILAEMARGDDALLSAAALAEKTHLPEPTVSKVLKLLAKNELITSTRGVKGGYSLKHPANQTSVSQIIAAIEGPVALTSCVSGSEECCSIQSHCMLQGRWNPVNRAVETALENVMLSDMMVSRRVRSAQKAEEEVYR